MAINNEELINMASQKLGIDKDKIANAKDSDGRNLLNSLSKGDKEKVSKVLNDPEMTKKILSSERAQELLRKFFGEK
mgnify:FL=1